jgi:DNA-directed RNA polymerase specialized sigma24 family protein
MPLDEQLFRRATKLERAAVEGEVAQMYPVVHRIALALGGREDVAEQTVRYVLRQAVGQFPKFRDVDSAERWMYHFTVLSARRSASAEVDPRADVLVKHALDVDAGYVAFVRGLRSLPFQQREAFILQHGEKLNERYLAVAMDCSTHAAEQHLLAATSAMQALAGPHYSQMVNRLEAAHARLSPAEARVRPAVSGIVAGALWPKRLKRIIRLVLTLAILAMAAYFAWKYWPFLRSLPQRVVGGIVGAIATPPAGASDSGHPRD